MGPIGVSCFLFFPCLGYSTTTGSPVHIVGRVGVKIAVWVSLEDFAFSSTDHLLFACDCLTRHSRGSWGKGERSEAWECSLPVIATSWTKILGSLVHPDHITNAQKERKKSTKGIRLSTWTSIFSS